MLVPKANSTKQCPSFLIQWKLFFATRTKKHTVQMVMGSIRLMFRFSYSFSVAQYASNPKSKLCSSLWADVRSIVVNLFVGLNFPLENISDCRTKWMWVLLSCLHNQIMTLMNSFITFWIKTHIYQWNGKISSKQILCTMKRGIELNAIRYTVCLSFASDWTRTLFTVLNYSNWVILPVGIFLNCVAH